MSLDRKTLEKVLGLPRHSVLKAGGTAPTINREAGPAVLVSDIEALLKGLAEAGEARRDSRLVAISPTGIMHFRGTYHTIDDCVTYCRIAPDDEDTRAWVARQRKEAKHD